MKKQETQTYECLLSFTYDAESPQDAVKQFLANIPRTNWYVDVKKTDTGEMCIVDTEDYSIETKPKEHDQRDMFTGGEWIASEVMNFSGTLVAFIKSSNGKEIAQLRGCETGEEKEAEANAALIAEAPAMYKALYRALSSIIILATELNYSSKRWHSEHTKPIEEVLSRINKRLQS